MKNRVPKIRKGANTRRRILETAVALMAERGPDAVSMREISSKLKITKPVLYYYFRNKEELIRAAFLHGTRHFRELRSEMSDTRLTLENRLELIFSRHLDFIRRYPDMPKCALKMMASPASGALGSMARELRRRNRSALRNMLENERLGPRLAQTVFHMVRAALVYFIIEAGEQGAASLDKSLPKRLAALICAGAKGVKMWAAAALLSTALARPASAETLLLSLDAAVETALRNNTAVTTAEETRRIYKERVTEYWGGVYPQLSAGAQYARNIQKPVFFFGSNKIKIGLDNAYAASLDLNQVLWAGGKVRTALRIADIYSSSGDEQLKTAQKIVTKAVKQMYYAVLLSSAMAVIQKETLDLAARHLAAIEAQYSQGVAGDLAVLSQRVAVSNAEPAVTKARNLYEEGLLELKNLLGLQPETGIALTGGFVCAGGSGPGDMAGLYKTALLNRPEYRNQKLQRDLYRETIAVEQAGHYPYLSAFASRQFLAASNSAFPAPDQQGWSLTTGLKLSLPLYSGGAVSSKVRQARLQAEIAETALKELERKIKLDVGKAWLARTEASERLLSRAGAVDAARRVLAATELRFKSGLASRLELNDSTLALNKSRSLHTQALHDVCSAAAELKWALGE